MKNLQLDERHCEHRNGLLIAIWFKVICGLIIGMIVLGGITRLTRSGLSIVEWKPVLGTLPPIGEAEWRQAFEDYQRHPEYRLINSGMSIAEFKSIYFWEYLHRLVGRLIGLTILIPGLVFLAQKQLSPRMILRVVGGLLLMAAQGALGWYMVRSGLVDKPYVSHYRLAAHLGLALLTLGYFFWVVLDLRYPAPSVPQGKADSTHQIHVRFLIALISLQILYGALTAGLKAGFGYNTFPKMNGSWLPPDFFAGNPVWLSFFENSAKVQFIHRALAWSIVFVSVALWFRVRRIDLSSRQKLGIRVLVFAVAVQFLLGVATLLLVVPITVAAIHQFGACIVFLSALALNHRALAIFVSRCNCKTRRHWECNLNAPRCCR